VHPRWFLSLGASGHRRSRMLEHPTAACATIAAERMLDRHQIMLYEKLKDSITPVCLCAARKAIRTTTAAVCRGILGFTTISPCISLQQRVIRGSSGPDAPPASQAQCSGVLMLSLSRASRRSIIRCRKPQLAKGTDAAQRSKNEAAT
jgi:hypothetical protein